MNYIIYLLKVSFILVLLYSVYFIFLRKLTFHSINRIYLLCIITISFIIPLLNIHFTNLEIINYPGSIDENFADLNIISNSGNNYLRNPLFSIESIILTVYLCGVFIVFTKLVISVFKLVKLKQIRPSVQHKQYTFVLTNEKTAPFSCFNWIFIPENEYHSNNNLVIEHEKRHAYCMHTLDLITTEFLIALLWFNPFVYFFRSSIKTIHEYQADSKVLSLGIQISSYLNSLYTNVYRMNLIGITSNFNRSTIKNRIKMMTTNKSNKIKLILYAIAIPVVFVIIMAFAIQVPKENVPNMKPVKNENIKQTSGFGMRKHPISKELKMHNGIDISAKTGTPVLAAADGIVIKKEFKEEGKGYGRMILIQHSEVYSTLYSQLSEFKTDSGDYVKQGQIIGLVGNSGISTGPHLHYEVHKNGVPVNPEDYFK